MRNPPSSSGSSGSERGQGSALVDEVHYFCQLCIERFIRHQGIVDPDRSFSRGWFGELLQLLLPFRPIPQFQLIPWGVALLHARTYGCNIAVDS